MDPDLIDLVAALKGGDVDSARRAELLARLRRDEAFQELLVDQLRLLGMLKAVQSMEPRWLRLHDELGWEGRDDRKREDALMRRIAATRPRPSRAIWRLVASALAASALVGLCVFLWHARHGHVAQPGANAPATGAKQAAAPTPRPEAPPVDYEEALALVVRLEGVDWGPGEGPRPSEGDLVPAGRLHFRSGRVTLSMLNGVVLIAEGPADFDLLAPDRIFCRVGRLRSVVPKGAEGLVITSPAAAVLDLGTEFGLNVEPGGRSRVKVFHGRVEAVARLASGDQASSGLVMPRGVVEIDPARGSIRPAVGPDEEFAAPLDLPTPPLVLDPAYPAAVANSGPRAYWRFEALDEGRAFNEVEGREPLRAVGAVHLSEMDTHGNRSAVFPSAQPLQYLVMDGAWEPAGPDYAVELWFLTEAVDHSCLVAIPTPAGTNNHTLILETSSRNRHAMHPPGSVRYLDRWPPSSWGGHNVYSRRPYVPFRWHHLVAQRVDGRMELYVDGRLTRSSATEARQEPAPREVVLGRLSTIVEDGDDDATNDWIFRRAFVGRIDEVALYDHGLGAEEIGRHHSLVHPRGPR
jgi:hypothetical protein